MEKYGKNYFWEFWGPSGHFKLKYGVPVVQEASKNLPGARGFVFPEYQPVAIHGDPIHPQNYLTFSTLFELVPPISPIFPNSASIFDFLAGTLRGEDPSEKDADRMPLSIN